MEESRFCQYGRCWLPEKNTKYLIQAAYMFISAAMLFKEKPAFTFYATLLLIAPALLDVVTTELKSPFLNSIRRAFIVLDSLLVIFCILGIGGILQDNGDYFLISEKFLYFPGAAVRKEHAGLFILINILVPIGFWIGSPCQDTLHTLEQLRKLPDRKGAKRK